MQVLVMLDPELKVLARAGRAMVTAALQFSSSVTLLVMGAGQEALVKEAAEIAGVSEVLWATTTSELAESIAACVIAQAAPYDVILASASSYGKNSLPRVAASLGVTQVSDVTRIIDAETFEHPIYAGNAIEVVKVLDQKKVLSIRTTAFQPTTGQQPACSIKKLDGAFDSPRSRFVAYEAHVSARPELTQASIVVSGGRALQSAEKFKLIEELADSLGAAVGASRAAVDAGFVPNDYQVGQTGKVVAPQLYIAIGISGAIQHLAGMQEAKVIVAINKDEDAPIFQVATYGLVGDLFELVPQLIQRLKTVN
ncbi:MAG: FAD-binding protein [Gammaproteobacteria bacterium]|nr:FAD-binding protein [Gammaproteobacteria bacterium]